MNRQRISLAAVVSLVFMFTALAPAAEPESFPICTVPEEQSFPAVSGNYVVWQDKRSGSLGYDLYRNNGANMNDANSFLVCNANYNQINPAISGTTIVWQDYRFSTNANHNNNCDIYRYPLPSGPDASVCTLTSKQESPAISGNIIVWHDYRNSNNDIFGNDGSEFDICTNTFAQDSPVIDGIIVVWRDMRNGDADIYGKNLQSNVDIVIRIENSDQQNPAISGNWVVWRDSRNNDSDIYGKNISTGEDREICKQIGSEQINPAISGDIVVWEDYRSGSGTADIYGYRISTHTVFPICVRAGDQKNPAISGNFVVWEDYRNGNADIYGSYIPEPVDPSILTITDPNGGETLLAGSKHTITWQATGTPIARVKLEYSTDNGAAYSSIGADIANTGSYLWQVPQDANSTQCRIKITDNATTPAAVDTSNNVFTIFKCDASLTADLSGDCYVDFEDFAIFSNQWLTCGKPNDPDWCFGL